jgi:hypothetical protein
VDSSLMKGGFGLGDEYFPLTKETRSLFLRFARRYIVFPLGRRIFRGIMEKKLFLVDKLVLLLCVNSPSGIALRSPRSSILQSFWTMLF